MPQCSGCRCDLPGFETLCSKCLETRYSELGHPKSFLESVLPYVSNSMGVTAESESKMPLPGAIFCCCGGVLVCLCAGSLDLLKLATNTRSSRMLSSTGHSKFLCNPLAYRSACHF